jgi:hypothetical protein
MNTKRILFLLPALIFTTLLFAQVNLTQNLRMYLPFTGNVTDASGNGNVVSINGPTLVADRFGTTNAAYHFDGINDFMTIALGAGMKPQYPFSFSCWIKLISTNQSVSTNYVFCNDYTQPGTNYYGTIMNVPATGTLQANVGDGGTPGPSSRKTKTANTPLTQGVWHHIAAVVHSATNMQLYVDCSEVPGQYSGTGAGLVYSQTGQGNIGRGNGGGGENYLNADLDEMRFYDRALNFQEISALYLYPNPPGYVSLGSNVQYLCPNGSLTLTPLPTQSINQWSDGSTGPSLNVTCPGEYWISITDGCDNVGYDTVDVQLAPALQQVNLGPDRVICPGQSTVLNATVSGATGYLWTPGNSTQPTLTATASGNYSVTVSNQCYTSTDAIQVTISNPAQQVVADPDTGMCYNSSLILHATAPQGVTLVWSNGTVGSQTTVTNPGVYWVNAVDQCGVVSDTIHVNLGFGCDTTTALIEHFSNDAKSLKDYYVNDTWVISNPPKNSTVIVYDARGRLVYTAANYTNNWKPDITEGIYYYVLLSDKQLVSNGRLLIVKQ